MKRADVAAALVSKPPRFEREIRDSFVRGPKMHRMPARFWRAGVRPLWSHESGPNK